MILGPIEWHYRDGLNNFLKIWKTYLQYILWRFSVANFLRTLFSPWKRDVSYVTKRGLHPVLFLQKTVENLFTRLLGAILKTFLIITALFLELLVVIFGFLLFILWITLPLAIFISLALMIGSFLSGDIIPAMLWTMIVIISLTFILISFFSFRGDKIGRYLSSDLNNLVNESWFSRVWDRLGQEKEKISPTIFNDPAELNKTLKNLDVSQEELAEVITWELNREILKIKKEQFWLAENLFSRLPIGQHWSYAYTVHLDRYATDLSISDHSPYRDTQLIGKEKDLAELELILMRPSQNSVILVGEAGIGKNTIIHTLARKIRQNKVGGALSAKRILELDLKRVISEYVSSGEIDMMLEILFTEAAYAGNVILIIKNIHEYLNNNDYDISTHLGNFLALPNFQIIATTTPFEFHATVEKKPAIGKNCDKIILEEMNAEDSLKVLLYKLKEIEKNSVIITYQGLREIVNLAERFITDSPFPEKALDLLEEVILYWSNNGYGGIIDKKIVEQAVSNKIKVPLGDIEGTEADKLLHLEDILHQRVVGQELAISQIVDTIRRARVGMIHKNKPLGSFLFLGPTGVGKTESAKALAEAYFGSEERMIRLDMSEYQSPDSIDRILGSAVTNQEGYLVSKVKETPNAILLIDEIEKAYPDILNLFLQILDEGHLTDATGKKINFSNLIIIATSNAGSQIIQESILAGMDSSTIHDRVIDHVIKTGMFKTELLNRFGGVIFFHPLSQEDIGKVTKLILDRCALQLKNQENLDVQFSEQVIEEVARKAYDPLFGARAINRFVTDKIEDIIAKKIIAGEVKKGDKYIFESLD